MFVFKVFFITQLLYSIPLNGCYLTHKQLSETTSWAVSIIGYSTENKCITASGFINLTPWLHWNYTQTFLCGGFFRRSPHLGFPAAAGKVRLRADRSPSAGRWPFYLSPPGQRRTARPPGTWLAPRSPPESPRCSAVQCGRQDNAYYCHQKGRKKEEKKGRRVFGDIGAHNILGSH